MTQIKKLEVGDWVYYIDRTDEYSIRKSRVKEKKLFAAWIYDRFDLLLEDGTWVLDIMTFNSRESAQEYIIVSLKKSIEDNNQQLASLQKRIAFEEIVLKRLETK